MRLSMVLNDVSAGLGAGRGLRCTGSSCQGRNSSSSSASSRRSSAALRGFRCALIFGGLGAFGLGARFCLGGLSPRGIRFLRMRIGHFRGRPCLRLIGRMKTMGSMGGAVRGFGKTKCSGVGASIALDNSRGSSGTGMEGKRSLKFATLRE